ncbi:MAG TPA: electron transfer flavoprotein subunit beta/FixA family protein [Armatimonadota bacterium]|nr:electron transfer flavoprotein subunit beta/FixA family protein [Armatimonadota bacterium]HOS43362.1 electron transfer flavoprotein subunit beta/FixA family protein [Armatimonadota bacterium]
MNIVVCIKQVPQTTNVKIDPVTNTLVREGVESQINPFDLYALEEAVRVKERLAAQGVESTVTVVSMGPPQVDAALREALTLGADAAVLLSDRAFAGSDTWATSYALAAAVSALKADLVFCGMQAIDGDTAQTGPGITVHAEYALATYVSKIDEISEKRATVHRLLEDGYEVCDVALPALFTVVKEINEPRTPSLRGKMRAKSAQIPVWTAASLQLDPERCGLKGSPTQVVKVFSPEHRAGGERWEGDPTELAAKLLEIVRERVTV